MCIGIPMQVERAGEFSASCRDGARCVLVDTTLLGATQEGDWLLVFLGAARERLDPSTALRMRDAVEAVSRIMAGEQHIEHLFDDLVGREPPLPAHLKHLTGEA